MFGRSPFRQMDEDPFFADHREQMRRMTDGSPMGFGMLEDRPGRERGGNQRRQEASSGQLAPFGDFGMGFRNMFDHMDQMMRGGNGMFNQSMSDGNGQCYQQSSFMSYSNTGQGAPKVFQASSSERRGPGGVRETRKAVRDSEKEQEKISVGHHIHDRGHEVQRHKNTRSGNMEEVQNFHNIDEAHAEEFNREWTEKTKQAFQGLDYGRDRDRRQERRRDDRRAMPDSRERQRALPAPRSEHWGHTPEGRSKDRQ